MIFEIYVITRDWVKVNETHSSKDKKKITKKETRKNSFTGEGWNKKKNKLQ